MDLDKLREALTSSRNARIEEVEIELEGAPWKVGVRQPSMSIQGRLMSALHKAAKAEDPAMLNAVKVDFALECLVDLDTRAAVFDQKFRDVLKAQPSGGWIDRVFEIAMRLMNSANIKKCPAKDCGKELMMGAPKCPWCGADVPHPAEVAEGN
jgi:hypothetical protein